MKHEKISKENRILDGMNYVDMDLVDAAGEDRRQPPLDKKRWPRRILGRVVTALITMAVVAGLVFTAKERMQWNTPEWNDGGAFVNYADLICYEGQLYFVTEAPAKDAVGEKIGKIGASWIRHPEPDPDGKISATHLPKNAPVHVWAGYEPTERICAQREKGEWAYYVWECDWAQEQADREPLDIKVVTPEDAEASQNAAKEEASKAGKDEVYYLGGTYTRYLGPELLNNASVGAPIGELMELPPDGTSRHAVGTVVYRWSGYDPWLRIAIRSAEGGHYYYERWTEEERGQLTMAEYLPQDSQVTAISLRKRDGALVGMITDEQEIRSLLAVLRQETELSHVTNERTMDPDDGRHMDLILTDGSRVRCMLCNDEFGYSLREFSLPERFLEKLHSYEIYTIDESLGSVNYGSPLVAEWARPSVREIEPWEDGRVVYTIGSVWLEDGRLCMGHSGCEGPFVTLQVRDGVVWTLDKQGVLRREEQEIAAGVTCFVLDASGTLYGTEDGLYRLSESTGETVRLADGQIITVASGGMTAYYGTANGGVGSVWIDGSHGQDICQMAVRQLCPFPYSRNNGHRTSLLEYEDGLLLIDEENRAWIRKGREEMFLLAESVQTVQYLGDHILRVEHLDGTQENRNLLYDNGDRFQP